MLDKPKLAVATATAVARFELPELPAEIESRIDIPDSVISEEVDVPAARQKLLRDLLKIKLGGTPDNSTDDNVLLARVRVAAQMRALLEFATAICPSAARELQELTRETAQGICAALDQNDKKGGHPFWTAFVKAPGRPEDYREKHFMHAAAAASVSILLDEGVMREPQARSYVARRIGRIDKLSVSAETVKKWRATIAERNPGDPKPDHYDRLMAEWESGRQFGTPIDFVHAVLTRARVVLQPTLQPDPN